MSIGFDSLPVMEDLESEYVDVFEDYGYTGGATGRRSVETLKRKTNKSNPWMGVRNQSVRLKKNPGKAVASQLLDDEARKCAWYCLDVDRENAIALLEELQSQLSEGSFVVSNSRKEFAMLTCIFKDNLFNIPIDAGVDGLSLKLKDVKSSPMFANLTALIDFYAAKKQKGMQCALNKTSLENELGSLPGLQGRGNNDDNDEDEQHTGFVTASGNLMTDNKPVRKGMENPGYNEATERLKQMNIVNNGGYNNGDTKQPYLEPKRFATGEYRSPLPRGSTPEAYANVPGSQEASAHEGFITISNECFKKGEGVTGVTFQPCQDDEWFFMGLSNVGKNHHGKRDQHYDDIDYCIGVMGHGKATARENEDEVGPYVSYTVNDTFTIRINHKKNMIEFAKNKKIFHTSLVDADQIELWAVQAFHPLNGSQTLIKNSTWLRK
eukprot:m.121849 g.121849  ORF g.121849 m.121849 type:complete len:437 (-) comp28882_c1_seq1:114-1424(-)